MLLPPKLTHGDNLANLFEKFNAVIDYLREIRLVAGHGIRINRLPTGTTIESTATATGGSPTAPADQWAINVIEGDDYIDVKIHATRAEDRGTLRFRGKTYTASGPTFRITRSELETGDIFPVIVKRITAEKIDFTLALTRMWYVDISNFSSGIRAIGQIRLVNGTVTAGLFYNSMIEWEDAYFGNGLFTADLGFTDIPEDTSAFSDFLDTAKQVLAVSQRFPICVNNTGIHQTGQEMANVVYNLFDMSPDQIGDEAQRLYWCSDYGPGPNGEVPIPQNYRFELKAVDPNHPVPVPAGFIRIPVAYISGAFQSRKYVRRIENLDYYPSNFPMLYINPFGKDLLPVLNGFLYLDLYEQTLKCKINCYTNAGIGGGGGLISLAAPFSAFSSISTRAYLTVNMKYNYETKIWSIPWFAVDGTPLTTRPEFTGTLYSKRIAVLSYNSETQRPNILAQNFSPTLDFDNSSQYFDDFERRIAELERQVDILIHR